MNNMDRLPKVFVLWTVMILLLLPVGRATALDHPILYFFWGEGCPHCEKEKQFLPKLQAQYPELEMRWFETWNHPKFSQLADAVRKAYKIQGTSVPMTFIGKWSITGFTTDTETGKQIEAQVAACLQSGEYIDALDMIGPRPIAATIRSEIARKQPEGWELFPATAPPRKVTLAPTQPANTAEAATKNLSVAQPAANEFSVPLPWFKKRISVTQIGLPLFTVIIGFLDGLNPCAMWVLSFLLTLVVYAQSRSKILLIGGIFVFASGFIYFVFMAAWINLFVWGGRIRTLGTVLRILVALVAIVMGLINCKDFFFFKKGISLTIPESAQPRLFKKMRALVQAEAIPTMIFGTIVLAVTANLVEFGCTAGFPAIYTNILTTQGITGLDSYLYLIFYNIVYVVPLATIVGVFAWKMGGRKLTEKEGRILKLIGGVLMLGLGIILLVKPGLLTFRVRQ